MNGNGTAGTRAPGALSAVAALAAILDEAGLDRLYMFDWGGVGVLSVKTGLTVWRYGGELVWTHRGEPVTWPATDIAGAATALLAITGAASSPAEAASPSPG